MFEPREYIGMTFDKAKQILESKGFVVKEVPNTSDDKHNFDTKLVVRVDINNNIVTLITAKFLFKI